MVCEVSLKPGRLCFDIGDVHFERVVFSSLTKIREVGAYQRQLSEVDLVLEYQDGTVEEETFSILEELWFLNYPNFHDIADGIEAVRIKFEEKSVGDYYMNLNGYAYDPFEEEGSIYIRVANLRNKTGRATFCVVGDKLNLAATAMSEEELRQVGRDLPRNVDIILEGLT